MNRKFILGDKKRCSNEDNESLLEIAREDDGNIFDRGHVKTKL